MTYSGRQINAHRVHIIVQHLQREYSDEIKFIVLFIIIQNMEIFFKSNNVTDYMNADMNANIFLLLIYLLGLVKKKNLYWEIYLHEVHLLK